MTNEHVQPALPLSVLLSAMKEKNLCCYFILPLFGIGPETFGAGNLVNAFLVPEEELMLVEVRNSLTAEVLYGDRPAVYADASGREFLAISLGTYWANDIALFQEGRYSRMSEEAKERIRQLSGLVYRQPQEDITLTDFRLLALERAPELREVWKQHLYGEDTDTVFDLEPDLELLEAPGPSAFLSLESLTLLRPAVIPKEFYWEEDEG